MSQATIVGTASCSAFSANITRDTVGAFSPFHVWLRFVSGRVEDFTAASKAEVESRLRAKAAGSSLTLTFGEDARYASDWRGQKSDKPSYMTSTTNLDAHGFPQASGAHIKTKPMPSGPVRRPEAAPVARDSKYDEQTQMVVDASIEAAFLAATPEFFDDVEGYNLRVLETIRHERRLTQQFGEVDSWTHAFKIASAGNYLIRHTRKRGEAPVQRYPGLSVESEAVQIQREEEAALQAVAEAEQARTMDFNELRQKVRAGYKQPNNRVYKG